MQMDRERRGGEREREKVGDGEGGRVLRTDSWCNAHVGMSLTYCTTPEGRSELWKRV